VRYGFVLGGLPHIPGRVLRLGQRFDFIAALSKDLHAEEVKMFVELMRGEAEASTALSNLLFCKGKPKVFRKCLIIA
jgi:hypothetical protein